MNKRPVFSIVMPVYNVEKYINDAIDSVLRQTFRDFELLVINDGSTDDSIEIVTSFQRNDDRINIVHQQNLGLSSARNTGIRNAKGEYIYFLDSDDYIEHDTLERALKIFSVNDIQILFFRANAFLDGAQGPRESESIQLNKYYGRDYLEEKEYAANDYHRLVSQRNNFVASACLYITRYKVIEDNDLLFEEGIIYEDELYTRQLLLSASKVFFSKASFYHRRVRVNSITTSVVSEINLVSLITVAEKLLELGKKYQNSQLEIDAERVCNRALSLCMVDNNFSNRQNLIKLVFRAKLFCKFKTYRRRIFIVRFPFLRKVYRFVLRWRQPKNPFNEN